MIRRFRTRAEQAARLRRYAESLEAELTAVEERIEALSRTDEEEAG